VNDVVLAILELRKTFERILYIDIDIHHGDGVEGAFYYSDKICTLDFHRYEPGFYPGTGSINNIGAGNGKYFTVNVPLLEGITDQQYTLIFTTVLDKVVKHFCPNALVLVCGADCLRADPLGGFCLTLTGLLNCVRKIKDLNLPLLVLGGGGYHSQSYARMAACVTNLLSNRDKQNLPESIPQHFYSSTYSAVDTDYLPPSSLPTLNTEEYLQSITDTILNNIERINTLQVPSKPLVKEPPSKRRKI